MAGETIVTPPVEINKAFRKIKAAQQIGRTAASLENQARLLRESLDLLDLETVEAPDGHQFKVQVNKREGVLFIEPFIHRRLEWGDAYRANDSEYKAMVKKSPYVDTAAINVASIEFDSGSSSIWGYVDNRGLRVLIDHNVNVTLIEEDITGDEEL